ncbi:EpsG family protein [Carnobacterium alterfunditum]|uniref:EpsG family protein n=1 Tax=Carnobacterium alterfunditum TaxID=28230 RepID=UPI003592FCFD
MLLYLSLFIILLILASAEVLLKNKKISVLTGGLLAIVAGLRFYTGYDFTSYSNFYSEISNISDVFNGSIDAESGFLFINYIFKSMGFNFYFFLLFFSVLSILLLGNFAYKYTPYPSLILVYYFARFFLVRDMGQIRSSLACIILLYAIPYILKKKPIQFLLIVFMASLFHVTAWVFVIAYIFNSVFKNMTIKNVILLICTSLFIGIIVQVPSLYIWAIPERYNAYFTSDSYTNGQWIMNPILWMQLALFFGASFFVHPTDDMEIKRFDISLKIYLIASLMLLAAGTLGTVGGRLSTLFATIEILLVPYLFANLSKNKLVNILLFCGFTIIIFYLIFIMSGAYLEYVPYQTIFGL